jgi:hypothetical protein
MALPTQITPRFTLFFTLKTLTEEALMLLLAIFTTYPLEFKLR